MTVSLYGNLFFVIIELIMAIYTSSQAVLLDAVYDAVEFIMLLPSIFLIPLLYKPSNEKHPFGYLQIESMFVVVKGVTMTAVTLGLIANNIEIMFHGGRSVSFHTVAYFELAASILGVAVFIYLKNKNKVVNSPLVAMEMRGWQIDSIVSMGMTIAFFLPIIVTAQWFDAVIPYLDQIITVVLSIFHDTGANQSRRYRTAGPVPHSARRGNRGGYKGNRGADFVQLRLREVVL